MNALDPQIGVTGNRPLKVPLTADAEHIVLDANIKVLFVDPGNVCPDDKFILGLVDVDCGRPRSKARLVWTA